MPLRLHPLELIILVYDDNDPGAKEARDRKPGTPELS